MIQSSDQNQVLSSEWELVLADKYHEAAEEEVGAESEDGSEDEGSDDESATDTSDTKGETAQNWDRLEGLMNSMATKLNALETAYAAKVTAESEDSKDAVDPLVALQAKLDGLISAQEATAAEAAVRAVVPLDPEGSVVAKAFYNADPSPTKGTMAEWLRAHKKNPSSAPGPLRPYLDSRDKPEGAVSNPSPGSSTDDAKIHKIAKAVGYVLDDNTFAAYKLSGLWKKHEKLLAARKGRK